MKKKQIHWLSLFLLITFACNLPQSVSTPSSSSTGSENITATAEVNEEDLPPISITELYFEKVRNGEWTEADGIIAILKYALSEGELEVPESIDEIELTSIVSIANNYLQTSSDENSKAEIQKLLDTLFPSEAKLDALSISEGEAFFNSGKTSALATNLQMACEDIWRLTPNPDNPLGPCFLRGTETVQGKEHRVYFPIAYQGDETKTPYYQAAKDVLRDAISVYSEFGEMPRVYMVFVPYLYRSEGRVNLIRAGVLDYRADQPCPVIVFSRALDETIDDFKQVMAHELFHCFQHKHISQHRSSNYEITEWAREGSAVYFSNVVYPETDHEYRELEGLDVHSLRTPLYQLSYKTFHFFQHMGNQWGDQKVIEFLKAMPITGSYQDVLNALVAYPNFIDLYESYARHYLAKQVMDTSGAIYPYDILYAKVNLVSAAQIGDLPHNPFVLYREKFVYDAPQLDYTFTTSVPNTQVRIGTTPVDFPTWQSPTWHVDTSCNNWEYMTYSIGITNDPLGRLASYEITTTETSDEKPCDECLVGVWKLDPLSYLSYANSLFARNTNPPIAVGYNGEMFMEYTLDGKAAATYNNFVVYYKNSFPDPNGGPKIQANLQIQFFPLSAVGYSADASSITYTGGRARIEAKGEMVLPDGVTRVPYNVPSGVLAGGGVPVSENYVCKGNYLAVIPNLPAPASSSPQPIFFYRFAPPSP